MPEEMASKKFKKKAKNKKVSKLMKLKKPCLCEQLLLKEIDKCQSFDHFPQIREKYFSYLQNVIKENLDSSENKGLPKESLEAISLEVEQEALLACMRSDVYQSVMINRINDIQKSTQKMKLYSQIKNLMLSKNLKRNDAFCSLINGGENTEDMPTAEVYSHIPTISSARATCNSFHENWTEHNIFSIEYESHMQSVNNFECENNFISSSVANGCSTAAKDQIESSYSPPVDEQYLSLYHCNSSNFLSDSLVKNGLQSGSPDQVTNGVVPVVNANTFIAQNLVPVIPLQKSALPEKIIHRDKTTPEKIDPILRARNELQKSVEKSLSDLKKINVLRREEQERAQIARILEDDIDDYLPDNQYDSLSDNGDEAIVNSVENERNDNLLADRLEEMRQIFGMENDEEEKTEKIEKINRRRKFHKNIHLWHHERVIQMHRLSLLSSEMTMEMRHRNRRLILELFGEDSDEENEIDFYSEEKYVTSCKERISSWVVKYLMPFYQKKRIVGRNVFKSLGHHISNSIIEQIKYPDEWTVKYLVTKFFPSDKQFTHESDVSCYQIE